MNDDPRATDPDTSPRPDIAFRVRVAHGRGDGSPARGRTVVAITLPSPRATVLALLLVVVAFVIDLPGATRALLSATTGNPANEIGRAHV